MSLCIILPYREGAQRRGNLKACISHFKKQGGCKIVVSEEGSRKTLSDIDGVHVLYLSSSAPFNKSAAVNNAVCNVIADKYLIHDIDILTPINYVSTMSELLGQYEYVKNGGNLYHLQMEESIAAMHRPFETYTSRFVKEDYPMGSVGITMDGFIQVGGMDERFIGWGHEDKQFLRLCKELLDCYIQPDIPMVHLWHPPADKNTGNINKYKADLPRPAEKIAETNRNAYLSRLIAPEVVSVDKSGMPSKTPPEPSMATILYVELHTAHWAGGAAQASALLMKAIEQKGYAISRMNHEECMTNMLDAVNPEVVIICGDLPKDGVNRLHDKYPDAKKVQYIQDPSKNAIYVDTRWDMYDAVIANSEYTREWVLEHGGPDSAIQIPYASKEHSRTDKVTPKHIMSVHMAEHKGGPLFEKIAAAMPDQSFAGIYQNKRFEPHNKGNFLKLPWHENTRDAYKNCAVLVQPSMFEEAYCRAVDEAVGNGIPVVASDWGNLPYLAKKYPDMITIVKRDAPVSKWVTAIKKALKAKRIRHDEVWDIDVSPTVQVLENLGISKIDQKISICITLRNRAGLLDGYMEDLKRQNYDLKDVEICISDGNSTDNLKEVMQKHASTFGSMKYGLSDRSRLPYPVKSNNPAADINAQVCNLATHEKIIRTDAEMRYKSPNTLALIARELEDKTVCFTIPAGRLLEGHDYPADGEPAALRDHWLAGGVYVDSFFCSCFNKSEFIRMRGVDERYCLGFAAEDTYFHWYWKNNSNFKHAPLGETYLDTEYMAYHLYHPEPMTEEYRKIRDEYTLPLMQRMKAANEQPNDHCIGTEWQRPEMLSDVEYMDTMPHGITDRICRE